MIRWCSYCQAFLGEARPFDSAVVTHGVCDACDARLEKGEALIEATATVRDPMNRTFACAAHSDVNARPGLLSEASVRHLPSTSALVGLLQPALYRVGTGWEDGDLTVAAEHRFTAGCDRFFSQLLAYPRTEASLDVLGFLAPGNTYSLGPRFAAELLGARGIRTEAIVPELPRAEMVAEIGGCARASSASPARHPSPCRPRMR